jgi:molybdopterin adenylyltransferase
MPGLNVSRRIVSDEPEEIRAALKANLDKDFILTSGGTGIGPRDKTPNVTEAFCDCLVPGIAEYLRRESCRQTVNAVFSRGQAGIKGKTLIINLPGSQKGAQYCAELLVKLLPHAHKMMHGGGH